MPVFDCVELIWIPTGHFGDLSGRIDIVVDGIYVPFLWNDGAQWRINPSDRMLDALGAGHLKSYRANVSEHWQDIEDLVQAILSHTPQELGDYKTPP